MTTTLTRILLAGIGGGVVFVGLLGYRTDYAGHYLAGFGGTLGLLALPLATARTSLHWQPFGVALVAILLGVATETTIFRIAIFDPVDFFNQSLGAAWAAISVQGQPASRTVAFSCMGLALAFLAVGGAFAFA